MAQKCGMKTEQYSRVVGYFRPVKTWHEAKRQEFGERKVYKVPSIAGLAGVRMDGQAVRDAQAAD